MENELDRGIQHHALTQVVFSLLLMSGAVLIQSAEAVAAVNSVAAFTEEGDPAEGEQVYARCIGCHSLDRNRTGPKHCELFGRKAGTVEGYPYSSAMMKSAIVWDQHSLDNFLRAPLQAVPGTTMGFAGIKGKQDRYNLVAYLKQASASETCRQK